MCGKIKYTIKKHIECATFWYINQDWTIAWMCAKLWQNVKRRTHTHTQHTHTLVALRSRLLQSSCLHSISLLSLTFPFMSSRKIFLYSPGYECTADTFIYWYILYCNFRGFTISWLHKNSFIAKIWGDWISWMPTRSGCRRPLSNAPNTVKRVELAAGFSFPHPATMDKTHLTPLWGAITYTRMFGEPSKVRLHRAGGRPVMDMILLL